MPISFTVGGESYDDLASDAGQYALFIRTAGEEHDVKRFHPPAVSGNLLIFNGRTGMPIPLGIRYIGDLATILTAWKEARDSWVGQPVDITDDEGTTYTTCTLVPGSCQRLTDPKPMGDNDGNCFFDVAATFTWDGN